MQKRGHCPKLLGMKKKMDPLKKAKLIYSGELFLFTLIAATLSILFLTGVIPIATRRRYIFPILSLIGGTWALADFIWALASPKRRAKISMLDKILLLPMAFVLIPLDIMALINVNTWDDLPYKLMIGIGLGYVGLVYLIEAIYHWFKPIPGLLDDDEEEEKDESIPVEAKEVEEEKPQETEEK